MSAYGIGSAGKKVVGDKNEINIKFMVKMATEIERKFLVKSDFIHLAERKIDIAQYYISIDPDKTIRLRIVNDTGYLSIKTRIDKRSIVRGEWEYKIPVEDAYELVKICMPGKIVKTRYLVPSGIHVFEVDVFHEKNDGLVIAEIELNSVEEEFERPEWLGEEVTGLPEYYNANLIRD